MVDMKSLRELLILGPGPSSSHTIGPYRIVQAFKKEHGSDFHDVEVILKGSLSLTGKGHGTDRILRQAFDETPVRVRFEDAIDSEHPNTMVLIGHKKKSRRLIIPSEEEPFAKRGRPMLRKIFILFQPSTA